VCCQGMPRDNGYGGCGCPDPLIWDKNIRNEDGSFGKCVLPRAACGNPEAREGLGICNKDPRTNFFAWLLDRNCFMDFFNRRGGNQQPPYKAACCPYSPGEGYDEVWDFDLPDSKIQVY